MGYTLAPPKPRILVLRHRNQDPAFYDQFLLWLVHEYPEQAPHFYVHDLPDPVPDHPSYRLLVPWMQDPIQDWSPIVFSQVSRLSELLRERDIPTINRVENQTNTTKFQGSEIIRSASLRTPKMCLIDDPEAFRAAPTLEFPFLIREDRGHRGPMIRVESEADVQSVDFSEIAHPVAVEWVDVQNTDGLFRKYRFFVAGRFGVSHHMVVSQSWVTHGDNRFISDASREEELSYLRADDPFRDRFFAAAEALGLDLLAFDYGFDALGEPVVWEANPYPSVRFGVTDTVYRNAARHRTFRCMLAMYLDKAGLELPDGLERSLDYPMAAEEEARYATIPTFLP